MVGCQREDEGRDPSRKRPPTIPLPFPPLPPSLGGGKTNFNLQTFRRGGGGSERPNMAKRKGKKKKRAKKDEKEDPGGQKKGEELQS